MKKKLLLPLLFALPLASCGETSYLKSGETLQSGNLSITMLYFSRSFRLSSSDSNRVYYELSYNLRSHYERIMSLGGLFYYTATFDGASGNGGIVMVYNDFPSSIAPDGDAEVSFTVMCLLDWKEVVIAYDDNGTGIHYSFGIKRSDYYN